MKLNKIRISDGSPLVDRFRWIISCLILILAVIGNYFYSEISIVIRTVVIIFFIIIAFFLALRTNKGLATVEFVRASRQEIRKVIWPTRKETMQITLIVFAVSVLMALILWGIDSIMVYLIKLATEI
ncbi:preprotein translocase subunit [Candidatus Photodesmus katoptron]|uniref:Protein translocase subunit SecE n=1 Tax=Candidatus Photodesmus katoptron Akat1 TaxID=1236703 RepID=S3EH56_9GAMM|nr:preprotein translocase subunit SecE [Candidatus Photodesmus katoptron]EPE37518.1 preprotein translocase subunit SecE [Candidatus Photodesmus katoptron Akat1]KEY90347.1 preprotein translocase subunit [Candidatus Photodesmus katoptron]